MHRSFHPLRTAARVLLWLGGLLGGVAFAQGAYEVENSRVAPGGGERLVDEAVRLLKELSDAKP